MEFHKCLSAWLIVRFVDTGARFVFYPQGIQIKAGTVIDVSRVDWNWKHMRCTSDCVWKSLNAQDSFAEEIVEITQNVELDRWQLEQFPQDRKFFQDISEIVDSTLYYTECLCKFVVYFDELYKELGGNSLRRKRVSPQSKSDSLKVVVLEERYGPTVTK
jgi:hypothetical protein